MVGFMSVKCKYVFLAAVRDGNITQRNLENMYNVL